MSPDLPCALLLLGLAVLGIGILWWRGHPAILDRGEGRPRPFWDDHSPGHFLGSAALALVLCWFAGAILGALGTLLVGLLIELAQRYPRDRGPGYFGWEDVGVDLLGIAFGLLICAGF